MSFLQYLFFFKLFRSIPLHYNNAIMNDQALAHLCTADSREFIRLVRNRYQNVSTASFFPNTIK